MKDQIKKEVVQAIKDAFDEEGLSETVKCTYGDFDFDFSPMFLPKMKDPNDDEEFNRASVKCSLIAQAVFFETMGQLKAAQTIIQTIFGV